MSLVNFAKKISRSVADNSPLILTSVAVAGVVSTVILAVKATPEAVARIMDFEIKGDDDWVESNYKEKIAVAWPVYIPALAVGATTIACIIGAQSINNRRNAALISAYSLSETVFKEYQAKVIEQIGKGKEEKVRDDIAQDHVNANPLSDRQVIITGSGNVLCYEKLSGRYFQSSMESLRKAQNDINLKCINEMYASQNDFYQMIGLPINGYGEEFGWSTDVPMEIDFSATIADDGQPAISIDYRMSPIRGYYKVGGRY